MVVSIVITGNPGVGKHTIAKKIAEMLKLDLIDINQIVIEEKIYESSDETRDVDINKLKKILKLKLKLKRDVLIVGHLAPYAISKSQVSKVIILRKSPYKLSTIYKKRNYSIKKINENIESEILGIIAHDTIKKFGKNKTAQIDTTGKTIQKVVSQTKNAIQNKKKDDFVDWLSLITKKNDLGKFFSYD